MPNSEAPHLAEAQAHILIELVNAGFTVESSIMFVKTGDVSLLQHTGYFSVQLSKPGPELR